MKTIGLIFNKKQKKIFLFPKDVKELTKNNIVVNIVNGYGSCLGIEDQQYKEIGANIFHSYKEVILKSDIICKIDAFNKKECKLLKNKYAITMASYLNNVDMLYYMLKNNVTGINWNYLFDNSKYVLFDKIESLKAECILQKINAGININKNRKKNKVNYAEKLHLGILNATFSGINLAKKALANNFDVTIFDNDLKYLSKLKEDKDIEKYTKIYKTKFNFCVNDFDTLLNNFSKFNIFVSTTINPFSLTKCRITKEMVESMPNGSIAIDASYEYGDSFSFLKKKSTNNFFTLKKNILVSAMDLTNLISLEVSKIISINSYPYLIRLANENINQNFLHIIICKAKKILNENIRQSLHLY